eukprot:scaffold33586_cov54-Phaeocystis_antarctica.AAC.2
MEPRPLVSSVDVSRERRGRTGGRGRNHRAPASGARGGGGRGRGASFGEWCAHGARGTKTVRGGPVDAAGGTTARIGDALDPLRGHTACAGGPTAQPPNFEKPRASIFQSVRLGRATFAPFMGGSLLSSTAP